ncbi:MAG TPA: HAD family hydrolase [Chloroflexota bacterium]
MRAVTFDFWGTLVSGHEPPEKRSERYQRLAERLATAGYPRAPEEVAVALDEASRRADTIARERFVDVGPPGRWRFLLEALGVPAERVPYDRASADALEGATLSHLPEPIPGVAELLQVLRGRYRLAVISNTGITGGTYLRQVLAAHRLLDYFDVLSFSNEVGTVKPHPRIFWHTLEQLGVAPSEAVHVGDVEELDVAGARNAGLRAVLHYVPHGGSSGADHTFQQMAEVPTLLEGLCSHP